MKRFFVQGFVLLIIISSAASVFSIDRDTTQLRAKPIYGKEAKMISNILDNHHYRKLKLNDSLSSAILDKYINELDNNKTHFLASDIKSFEKYRYSIDDMTRQENVDAAFAVYSVFKKRYSERMKYVMTDLVNRDYDFSAEEFYETDRDKMPWATTSQELDDIWRKIVKSQALSLKLANKKPADIKETLRKRYERFNKSIDQFNSEDVFNVYMNAITEAYDPHTNYFSPKASAVFKQSMSLSLEGIGAQLQNDNDYTKINAIIPGGPAEKSEKIHAGDLITGVAQGKDGEMVDVVGWRTDEVVKLIKGPKGTTVRLQFLPAETGVKGPAKEITLVRDKIKLEDQAAKKTIINHQMNGKEVKLGVITLPSFYMDFEAYQKGDPEYRSTTRDVKNLIIQLQKEGIEGLVIDLRNNGGGSLPEAINLAGLFIKDGPVVQVKSSDNKIQVGNDDDKQLVYNGPLVVMTNRFSASASEIFAGAIQDYQRGIIVGESTFGKGTVQTVLELNRFLNEKEEVGQLNFTIQKFYRVTGSSTQNKGVTPDVKLPTALDATQYGESSNPNAMPWDVIKGTNFQKAADVNDRLIAGLNKSYLERAKFDGNLKKYISDTEDLKKNLKETKISLNEVKRKAEMDEAEKKKVSSDKLDTKLTSKETGTIDDLQKMDDEYLREGLLILGELVTKRIG